MAPFAPEFITDSLNLIVALIIGVAFGFVLEQAGFSSSRKLAGLFYGYDFTVLRVFFTAAATAMSGVIILGYFGLLDTEAIYVNPTWLWPAIVGGVIMGVGFVVGGYCPGTSICAAAIGKVDAMFFVGGGLLGVFIFGEFFPTYATFFDSSALGSIKVFESLGISAGVFGLALIVVAVGAFVATSWIEKRTNPNAPSRAFPKKPHLIVGVSFIVVGLILTGLGDWRSTMIATVSDPAYIANHQTNMMTVDELAFRIVDRDERLQIIDIRTPDEYSQLKLPHSVNYSLHDLFGKEANALMSRKHLKKVIVADDEPSERVACLLIERLGFENAYVLERGMPYFASEILDSAQFVATGSRWDDDVKSFRGRARQEIHALIVAEKTSGIKAPKVEKKVKGGC